MKKLLTCLVIILLGFASGANAEWLGCDIPDAGQDIAEYAVIVDSQPEVIVAYQLNTAADTVLIWDIENLDTAHFEIFAINSQGRRSQTAAPFDLRAKPLAPGPFRIVPE